MNDDINKNDEKPQESQVIYMDSKELEKTRNDSLGELCKVGEDLIDIAGKVLGKVNKIDRSDEPNITIEIVAVVSPPDDDEDDDNEEDDEEE